MKTCDTEIVTAIRDVLADRIGSQRFDLWFARTEFSVERDLLSVAARHQFTLDRLRDGFLRDLEEVGEQVLEFRPRVVFRVNSQSRGDDDGVARRAAPQSPSSSAPSSSAPSSSAASSSAPPQCDEPEFSAGEETTCAAVVGPPGDHGRSDKNGSRKNGSRKNSSGRNRSDKDSSDKRPTRGLGGRRFNHLESFVVGDCNKLAFAASEVTADRPGDVTPLLIYGPPGSGKTHLAEGIWTRIRRRPERTRCVYLTSEQFTTHFVEALQGRGLPSFRRRYRGVDLLVIEDIQFFSGKRATLLELQYTIDTLLREGRQMVFTSDCSPMELRDLGPELTTRISGGLVCNLQPACLATRREILRRGALQKGLGVPAEVLDLIATQLGGDVRQLWGALNQLQATSMAWGRPISISLAEEALGDTFQAQRRFVRLSDIERAVCDVFGTESKVLKSSRKSKQIAQPRMLAMWLARKHTRAALHEICEHFGRRSHSTVIAAQRKVDSWMAGGATVRLSDRDCGVAEAVRKIEAKLDAG